MIAEDPIGIIELGNIKIKCIIVKTNNENIAEILSTSSINSEGIHNGVIMNITKASNVIRSCISQAEKEAEISIKKINVIVEQPEFLCTKLSKDRKINGSKVQKEDIEFLLREAKKQVHLRTVHFQLISSSGLQQNVPSQWSKTKKVHLASPVRLSPYPKLSCE